ncbi:MAG: class I SAM-dependent methyltransferase [Promethearchaeota archaeon]
MIKIKILKNLNHIIKKFIFEKLLGLNFSFLHDSFFADIYNDVSFIRNPILFGKRIYSSFRYVKDKKIQEFKEFIRYGEKKLSISKIYWANPKNIKYNLEDNFFNSSDYSLTLTGDWDLPVKYFKDLSVYRALKQRIKEGKNWEEIEFYNRSLNEISKGINKLGCKNKEELEIKIRNIDSLSNQLKEDSRLLMGNIKYLKKIFRNLRTQTIIDKIIVVIGRNGQLIHASDGIGLSIAKLFNIPLVPIYITARHKKWMDFRKELIYFIRKYNNGILYQPITHPDLQYFPNQHGETRYYMIKENISISQGKILDIGANLGYFCHRFEDEGYDCYAAEKNLINSYFLKKLHRAENKKFKIILGSIFEYKKNQELHFDIVFALNIFHHFLKTKNLYLNLIKLLKRLNVKELYFGPHTLNYFRNKPFYRNYNPEQFVNFIIKNSSLKRAKFIGKTIDGRSLYKITSYD